MSKITPEAAARCAEHTLQEQLVAYRKELEIQAAIAGVERLLRERRVANRTINFPDRRGDADDFGHGL
jgi:hypothetical protein